MPSKQTVAGSNPAAITLKKSGLENI